MKLSILIVNFNGRRFFDECLASIAKNVSFEHEVIVVDNASSDGSVEYLQANFPNVRLIKSDSNLGFSGGNNLGAGFAHGEYLLLLNNDTVLLNDLSSAVSVLEGDSSIGILGARMQSRASEYRKSAGHFPAPWRLLRFSWLYQNGCGLLDGNFLNNEKICVDWIEGSFLMTPMSTWNKLGGLDESYFMYIEDVDYARRVVNLGMKVVYLPAVAYIHYGGSTPERVGLIVDGFRKYHRKNSGIFVKSAANVALDTGLLMKGLHCLFRAALGRTEFQKSLLYFRALRRK